MPRKPRNPATVADLLRAGIVHPGDEWRIFHRDGSHTSARINPDGSLKVGNLRFDSPSTAAVSVGRSPTNGWRRWKYNTGDGWDYVMALRSRL